jgi:uncharacterized protein YfaS (alpha-2-macroglobulin family)
MSPSRISLIATLALILLVACAGPTPMPTPIPQVATPLPAATGTPVPTVPTPAPLAELFPKGLTNEPLSVVTTAPADKAEDVAVGKEQTKIIVQFNHPVVPLVSVDAQKRLPQPLTITPSVGGTGEWINTSTYALTPAQNLTVATQYSVSVASLQDMLGQSLTGYTWSFKTASPAIIKMYPEDNTRYAGVSEPITMTFNTEMDRASTESRFGVKSLGTTPAVAQITGKFEWQGTVLSFVPDKPLDYDTSYGVTLKSGAQDANKVAATTKDATWSFRTERAPAVLSTNPANGETSAKGIRDGFTIDFASPMARDAITVTIAPTITNQSANWEYDSSDQIVHIQGNWLASRSYTVTISGESQTRYGEKLGKDTVIHFTAAPLDPMVSLNVPGIMGMYDVNGPQTIYAAYTNVDRIDYALYKVERADFLRLSGSNRYRYWDAYRPVETNLLRQWSVSPRAPLNATALISTTLTAGTDGASPLQPGVYYLEATSPSITAKESPAHHLLVVTGLNLALKRTETEALVWVTDLKTGKPVANQAITLYGPSGSPLASGTSDRDGIFRATFSRINSWDSLYALSESAGGGIVAAAGSDWNEGINTFDFNMPSQLEAQEFYANLYTDRAIYRPGQTVYFKGILRRDNDASYGLPTDVETVPIQVRDDQGKQVFKQDVPLTRFGTFNGEFKLSDAASIGFYNLSFELGADPHKFFSSVGFQVAQYRPPEFQLDVKTDKPEYVNGDTIQVDVDSTYFFGGPVTDAQITWRLLNDDLFFNTDKVKGYWNFTDYDLTTDRPRTGGVIRDGKGKTDAQGRFHFQVPADLKDFPLSQNFTIDVEITDVNNQSVSNRATVPVHKGYFYIGMRPQSYVGTVGKEQAVDVITVDTKGDPFPNQAVTVSFFQHEWFSVRQKREDGNFYWTSAYTDTLVSKAQVTTDAQGQAVARFTPSGGGVYKIVGEGTDRAGNKIRSATYLWVTGTEFVNWRIENNDRIDLVADKKEYAVGDTAEVLIPAPFKDSEALLTIERGTIRQVKRLSLKGNSETIRIPITSDFAPNVFVSVMLVKGRGADSPTPQFKLGYTNLAVATTEKELKIDVTADCGRQTAANAQPSAVSGQRPTEVPVGPSAVCQPGDKANFALQASDSNGKPVEAEFSMALVDKAIQSLVNETAQSPLQAFYGQRGLGVQTSATLVRSVERTNQQLSVEAKGGGGGALVEQPVRRNFQDTAFWKADVVTDAQGRAQVSVPLPDNLTTWNLTAKGVTAQTLVGLAKTDIMSTKPLLVRPVAPRFFVVGDKTLLEAVVNNNTDKDISADVRLDAQGLTLNSSAQQPLTIKAHDKAKVSWQTVANPVDQVVVTFSATGDGTGSPLQDALELTLPILRPTSAETVATAGQVDAKSVEQVQVPADADKSAGELWIDLSPSLAAATRASLDYLEQFGYECSEQTVSKFFPNVATYLALKKLGIEREDLRRALEQNVSRQVQRLYSLQHSDGGWGWWANDTSQPTLTAYALYGLFSANEAGFSVDAEVMNRAERYLVNYLDQPVDVKASYAYNERAFTLFVLTEKGGDYTGRAVSLFDKRANLDNYGKAFLLMTLQKAKLPQADTLAGELASAAIPSATGAHWEEKHVDYWTMNTNTRSTAIAIMALSRTGQGAPSAILTNAVRWLMVARKEGHWETTQETAWSVLGLTEFMVATGELNANYTYQVTVNGKALGDGSVDKSNVDQAKTLTVAIKDLLQNDANNLVITRSGDSGRLYYSAYLNYFLPADKIQALNRGILVGRQYLAVDQQTLKPTNEMITSAKIGDYVQVRLTLIAPGDLNYLVLEDPLPAGFEAVDTTLKTSSVAASGPQLKEKCPDCATQSESENDYDRFYTPYWTYWAHSEVRDDRVAVFATYLGRGTYEYTYLMRASVSGEFRALPAQAWEMYFPEVFGRSTGALFVVKGE